VLSVLSTLVFISKDEDSFKTLAGTLRNGTHRWIIGSNTSDDRLFFNDSVLFNTEMGNSARGQDDLETGQFFDLQNNASLLPETTMKPNHESNKTIFVCGYPLGGLVRRLFPDFVHTATLDHHTQQSSSDSILVHGLYGPCLDKRDITPWLSQQWNGKVLLVNGENIEGRPILPENLFRIGMFPDSYNSVHVLYLAIVLIGYFIEEENLIFNHTLKPQSTREKFCIYFVSNCVEFREAAADQISTAIKRVDQWGRCAGKDGTQLNKIFGTPRYVSHSPAWRDNFSLYRQYRFCLVMENSVAPGYITEKILSAFLGGCIPIYYGSEEIFDVFNRNAFVFYDIHNPSPALERIRYLEENETAYLQVSRDEPILAHGSLTIDKFFSLDDAVGNGTLKRKIRMKLGLDE
jgi:hypothetical protein